MPGLVGFAGRDLDDSTASVWLSEMSSLLAHQNHQVLDEPFAQDGVFATRSHIGVIQNTPQPHRFNDIYVWLDGEFFDVDFAPKAMRDRSDPEILAQAFWENKEQGNFDFLQDIDGIYSAVIFDKQKQEVSFITDRYGLRHLYFTQLHGMIAWSSETKAFLGLPDFIPTIDRQAVREFFAIGQLLENRTWFDNVSLVPSGSVLTFNLASAIWRSYQYWWWDHISPMEGNLDEREIVEELGHIFSQSVKKRLKNPERIGITLSGGLDSRAMLASMADHYPERIPVLTFGSLDCEDARLAKLAAAQCDAIHHFLEINEENWLAPRIAGVWDTDGHMDLMHMHGLAVSEFMREVCEVNLSGFSGDAILGGSFFKALGESDAPINLEKAAHAFHCSKDIFEPRDLEKYRTAGKGDFYLLQNRVRRFTATGTKQLALSTEQRKPFYDNRLIEFAYSLPDRLRANSHVYNKMLLQFYPKFFRDIPWQRTGLPIGSSALRIELRRIQRAIKRRVATRLRNSSYRYNYTDYPRWIREEPACSFFQKILRSEGAMYGEYLDQQHVQASLESHMQGADHSRYLCRCLTLELWLQQVYEGKYRDAAPAELELVTN